MAKRKGILSNDQQVNKNNVSDTGILSKQYGSYGEHIQAMRTDAAYSNKYYNPGNIEQGQKFAGETGESYAQNRILEKDKKPFAVFDSAEMGLRALAMDLSAKIKNYDGNISEIIKKYAGEDKIKTENYQNFIKNYIGNKNTVNQKDLSTLVKAVVTFENTKELKNFYLDDENKLNTALKLAFETDSPTEEFVWEKRQLPHLTSFGRAKEIAGIE